jgi:hypothetical protein
MVFCSQMTGGWTDWLAPEVLPLLMIQFFPFLFLPPLLIAATCLWKNHGNAAKSCLRAAFVAFVIGIVWEMLIL